MEKFVPNTELPSDESGNGAEALNIKLNVMETVVASEKTERVGDLEDAMETGFDNLSPQEQLELAATLIESVAN